MLFIINKITKYNLFYKYIEITKQIFLNIYNYKIEFIWQIYKITKYNLFYKYIKLQNTIYLTNIDHFFSHINTHMQLQNRIHFTFTLVNI